MLRDLLRKAPRGQPRVSPSHFLAHSHRWETAAIAETWLEGSLTVHTAQLPVPNQETMFSLSHTVTHIFHHTVFSKPGTSARARDGSLLHDAPGAIITTLLTTAPPAPSPTPRRSTPLPPSTRHVLHRCAVLAAAVRAMLPLPRCCQSHYSSAVTLRNT